MSFSPYLANAILGGTAIDHSTLWVQVHTDSPGASGLDNVAGASGGRVSAAFTVVGNTLVAAAQVDLNTDGTYVSQDGTAPAGARSANLPVKYLVGTTCCNAYGVSAYNSAGESAITWE